LTKDNPIRQNCSDKSSAVEYDIKPGRLTVHKVTQKQGVYWLKISLGEDTSDTSDKSSTVQYGWIKGKTKDKLLVNILLLC